MSLADKLTVCPRLNLSLENCLRALSEVPMSCMQHDYWRRQETRITPDSKEACFAKTIDGSDTVYALKRHWFFTARNQESSDDLDSGGIDAKIVVRAGEVKSFELHRYNRLCHRILGNFDNKVSLDGSTNNIESHPKFVGFINLCLADLKTEYEAVLKLLRTSANTASTILSALPTVDPYDTRIDPFMSNFRMDRSHVKFDIGISVKPQFMGSNCFSRAASMQIAGKNGETITLEFDTGTNIFREHRIEGDGKKTSYEFDFADPSQGKLIGPKGIANYAHFLRNGKEMLSLFLAHLNLSVSARLDGPEFIKPKLIGFDALPLTAGQYYKTA